MMALQAAVDFNQRIWSKESYINCSFSIDFNEVYNEINVGGKKDEESSRLSLKASL